MLVASVTTATTFDIGRQVAATALGEGLAASTSPTTGSKPRRQSWWWLSPPSPAQRMVESGSHAAGGGRRRRRPCIQWRQAAAAALNEHVITATKFCEQAARDGSGTGGACRRRPQHKHVDKELEGSTLPARRLRGG